MWTYEDTEGILENITVRRKFKDGVHSMTQLLAHEGYAIHNINDVGYIDEETGEYYSPTYSYQKTTSASNEVYLLANHIAVLIEEGMEIAGVLNKEEKT